MIHVLGDGPYAKEVVSQIGFYGGSLIFVSHGDDEKTFPSKIVVGIANPSVKKLVIEDFYFELEPETFVSAIHPTAIIADNSWDVPMNKSQHHWKCVNIGPYTTVGLRVRIEDFVSICANVTIGHDSIIGKYSTVCPGAIISGNVSIGEGTFIGAGAVIKNNISIGNNVTVGCGAVVVKDIAGSCVVYGNPAKVHGLNNPAWCNKS